MSGEIKELQIPDLWFDFYARLLPGTAFVVAVKVLLKDQWEMPEWKVVALILAGGYLLGLVTQPVASCLTERLENCVGRKNAGALELGVLQRRLGTSSRSSMILAKMHGETTFFVQLMLLSIGFGVLDIVVNGQVPIWMPAVSAIVAAAFAVEVACRRLRRATTFDEACKKHPKDGSDSGAKVA